MLTCLFKKRKNTRRKKGYQKNLTKLKARTKKNWKETKRLKTNPTFGYFWAVEGALPRPVSWRGRSWEDMWRVRQMSSWRLPSRFSIQSGSELQLRTNAVNCQLLSPKTWRKKKHENTGYLMVDSCQWFPVPAIVVLPTWWPKAP